MDNNTNIQMNDSEVDEVISNIMRSLRLVNYTNDNLSTNTTQDVGTEHPLANPTIEVLGTEVSNGTANTFDENPAAEITVTETPSTPRMTPLSESLIREDTTSRFRGAPWFSKVSELSITLVGLGGIGSYVAYALSRFHPKMISMYDPDHVERVNMSGQMFSILDIGRTKTDSIYNNVSRFSDYHSLRLCSRRFEEYTTLYDNIMICGVDNMEARKNCYHAWVNRVGSVLPPDKRKEALFIDGRMAAEILEVICIKGDDLARMKKYENDFLFDDSEAEELACSYKQTTFTAMMIGGIISNLIANFAYNLSEDKLIDRPLPFYTEYSASKMFLKVQNV